MFERIKIKRFDDAMVQLSFDGVSIMITCFKDRTMISTDDFETVDVTGQTPQVIGDNGIWLRNKGLQNKDSEMLK